MFLHQQALNSEPGVLFELEKKKRKKSECETESD